MSKLIYVCFVFATTTIYSEYSNFFRVAIPTADDMMMRPEHHL